MDALSEAVLDASMAQPLRQQAYRKLCSLMSAEEEEEGKQPGEGEDREEAACGGIVINNTSDLLQAVKGETKVH